MDHLQAECAAIKPDIVGITESWLDSNISDHELHMDMYNVIRLDRNRHGGGVALYIHNTLHYEVVHLGNTDFECIIVSVTVGSCKFCVCVVASSGSEFLDTLYDTLCSLNVDLFANFILIGDLNIDFLSHSHQQFSHLVNITTSFLLHQVVTSPTKFSHFGSPSIYI